MSRVNDKLLSSAVVKYSLVMTIMLSTALVSCSSKATIEDIRRLNILNKLYSNIIQFSLENDTYVKAKCILCDDETMSFDEAVDMYKKFFFSDDGTQVREGSSYTYMNIYSNAGKFKYQIFYDKQKKLFIKGTTDHY